MKSFYEFMEEAFQAAENTRRGRPFSHHEKRKRLQELLKQIEERKAKERIDNESRKRT